MSLAAWQWAMAAFCGLLPLSAAEVVLGFLTLGLITPASLAFDLILAPAMVGGAFLGPLLLL